MLKLSQPRQFALTGLALSLLGIGNAVAAEPVCLPLDGESLVRYQVNHPMHEMVGTAHQLRGELRLPSPGQPDKGSLVVVVPITAFDSGNRSRDAHMLEVLEAARFPGVMFKSESVQVTSTRNEGSVTHLSGTVVGKLVLHGQTKNLTAPFTATMAPGRWTASTTFEVSCADFGIARPALMLVPIEDAIRLSVELVTKPGQNMSVQATSSSR